MNIIIAGSRTILNKYIINKAIFNGINKIKPNILKEFNKNIIFSGHANGVDKEGESWAKSFGLPIKIFPAEWEKYGKKAGYIRNKQMIDDADALIAIWDGKSKGTKITIDLATKKGIPIYTEIIK